MLLLFNLPEYELCLSDKFEDEVVLVFVLFVSEDVEVVEEALDHVHFLSPEEVEVLEVAVVLQNILVKDVLLVHLVLQQRIEEHQLQLLHLQIDPIVLAELLTYLLVHSIVLLSSHLRRICPEEEEVGQRLEEWVLHW
eukprot:CAMPEP_0202977630 /NCGR_PEP_ID=MMETSP1396-20130829/84362_1 /ASSEMBLY_ACC=CAM_ASM_000872 /TAXON_ID= /ORGANISM="Pseudokeronopsis sp., Strain Brazil" /LENGTH=137 /DNA_ID=CAMNT_0049716415 /DNA_START=2834 /DNA_END=3244 /DNA_ORIENTATION=+